MLRARFLRRHVLIDCGIPRPPASCIAGSKTIPGSGWSDGNDLKSWGVTARHRAGFLPALDHSRAWAKGMKAVGSSMPAILLGMAVSIGWFVVVNTRSPVGKRCNKWDWTELDLGTDTEWGERSFIFELRGAVDLGPSLYLDDPVPSNL